MRGRWHSSRGSERHRPRPSARIRGRRLQLVVADVSQLENEETARLIEKQGGRALAVRCDVTRSEDVRAALDQTVRAFGRLDFAFNNAGIEYTRPRRRWRPNSVVL